MLTFKKSGTLLMISFIMLFILSACTQGNGTSQTPEQNQEGIQVESKTPEPSNEPSPSIPPEEKQEEVVTFDPVVLFELTEYDLVKPVTEIPYYAFGNIEYVTEEGIKSVAEGHSPWRGSPVYAAETLTQNLIPREIEVEPFSEILSQDKTLIGLSKGQIQFKVVRVENENQADELTVVDMNVPDLGTFTISLQQLGNVGISFITQIVWQPEASETLQQLEGSITLFNLEESWFDKQTNEIPSYEKGRIGYLEQAAIDDHKEGHSVPLSDPLVQTIILISNLVPADYLPDPAIDEQLGKSTPKDDVRKIVTSNDIEFTLLNNDDSEDYNIIEVKVPDFGKYLVIIKRSNSQDSLIGLIQKIEFQSI